MKETLFPSSIQDALLNSNLELSGWPAPAGISNSAPHWTESHERQPLLYTLASSQQVSGHVVQSSVYRNSPSLDVLLHLSRPNKHLNHATANHTGSDRKSAHGHSVSNAHEHLSAVIAEEVGDTTEESVGTGEPKPTTDSVRATSATHNTASSSSASSQQAHRNSASDAPSDLCAIVAACYLPAVTPTGTPVFNPTSGHCRIGSCPLTAQDACLVRLTLPADWWPPVNLDVLPQVASASSRSKPPRPATANVGYAAVHTGHCGQTRLHQRLLHRLQTPEVNDAATQPLRQHVKKAHSEQSSGSHVKHEAASSSHGHEHDHSHVKSSSQVPQQHAAQYSHPLPPVFVEPLGQVQLKPFAGAYEELTSDDIIRVLIPQGPLRPRSRLHIPVCYRYHREYPLFAFALRVKVRAGLRLLGARLAARSTATSASDNLIGKVQPGNNRRKNRLLAEYNRLNAPQDWRIAVEIGSKQTQATVTARVKRSPDTGGTAANLKDAEDASIDDEPDELNDDLEEFDDDLMALMPATCREVFTLLIEVDDRVDQLDSGRIVFQLLYLSEFVDSPSSAAASSESGRTVTKVEANQTATNGRTPIRRDFERDSSKLTTKLDLRKDEIRSLLAISRSRHLLNTAIFTGRQIVQPLQVFVVSEAGKFGEVTLQASCTSEDESVLKVSPSCSSLYLDGTESRPSTNATVLIKYGSYAGQASFQVWMPKLPLEIALSDSKLNAIDRWLTPHIRRKESISHRKLIGAKHSSHSTLSTANRVFTTGSNSSPPAHFSSHGSRPSVEPRQHASDTDCRPRYQQTYVDVFARFFTADPQSGREYSLLGRKHAFKITSLVQNHFRLSDTRVAAIRGRTVEGLTAGRTQLQLLSPLNGRLLGSQSITVTDEKVRIDRLNVRLVTGVSLQVRPQLTPATTSAQPGGTSKSNSGHHGPSFTHWPQPALWSVTARVSGQLRAQYQEGLLDIRMRFSDGSELALPDATDADYALRVNTFESPALAYAPSLAAPGQPRLLALRSASAVPLLLQVHPSQQCDRPHRLAASPTNEAHNIINAGAVSLDAPLAEHTMLVDVSIVTTSADNAPEVTQHVQNDAHSATGSGQQVRWHTSGSDSNDQLRSAAHLARAVHLIREPQVLARHQQMYDNRDGLWPTTGGTWVALIAMCMFAMVAIALLVHRQRTTGMFAPNTARPATTVTAVKPSDPDGGDSNRPPSDDVATDSLTNSRLISVQKVWGELRTFGAKCAAGLNDRLSDGGPVYTSNDGSVKLRENPCNQFDRKHHFHCPLLFNQSTINN